MSLALAFIFGVTALVAGGIASKNKSSVLSDRDGIVVGSEKDLRVTDFAFNDAGSSSRDVWSASKIEAFLNKNSPVYAASAVASGNVVFFGPGNELVDKGMTIDDSKPASASVVWSSAKMKDVISQASNGFMLKASPAVEGNLCTFDSSGQVVDTGKKVNDGGSSTSDIWTASKILSVVSPAVQMKLVPTAQVKTVAIFDSAGQVQSSGSVIDDSSGPSGNVIWTSQKTQAAASSAATSKMNLVPSAKAQDWAMFDGSGQLLDSGVALNDSGKTAADVWSASKIQSVVDAAVASANATAASSISAQTATCQKSIDDAKAINTANANAVAALSSDIKTKMNLVPTAKSGDVAVFDGSGQTIDSKVAFNDAGSTASDVWSASKISSTIASVQASINSQISNQTTTNTQIQNQIDSLQKQETNLDALLKTKMDLVPSATASHVSVFNGSGQVIDGGFALDDSASGAAVIWSADKMKRVVDASAATSTNTFNTITSQINANTSILSGKMSLQPTAKPNSVAVFNTAGQATGSNFIMNDAGISASDLWTAQRIQTAVDTRVSYSGVPIVNDLALWTSSTSVGDARVSINDAATSTSNLWTAAQTKAYWDAQMLKTYSNKCWFRGNVVENVTIGASKQNLQFNVTDTAACSSIGVKTSVPLPRAGAYQINLWLLLSNAASANGKMLVFTASSTQSLRMPIYVVNGMATVSYQTVCLFSAGAQFAITVQLVNVDGTTPATGSSVTVTQTNGQGNLFSVQEM
jgi:hypothetical protein